MNASQMNAGQRAFWLLVMPLLAGVGLYTLISWLPGPWELVAITVICVGGLIYAIREIRWSRRMQREIAEDLKTLEKMLP